MVVGINASLMKGIPVGLEVYTLNLVRLLSKNMRLLIYTSKPELFEGIPCDIKKIPEWTQSHHGRFIWEQLFLPFLIIKDKIDVLFSPLPELPILSSVPSIAVVHDLTPLVVRSSHTSRYKLFFWLTLQSIRRATLIIVDSENTKRDLMRLRIRPRLDVFVVYIGSKFELLPNHYKKTEIVDKYRPYILYVGGFAPAKNVVCLLEAFSIFALNSLCNLVLVGWGTDWHLEAIKRVMNRSPVKERILLLRNIADPELFELYCNAEVFVCPSFYEGFGLPLLEALSCGTPVICSNASSLPEVGHDAVIYFNPNSHIELAYRMREVLENSKLCEELSLKGLKRAKDFSWTKTASETEACIRKVIDSFHN